MVADVEKGDRTVNYIALVASFLVLIAAMSLSAFLIYRNQVITGTIFAGAAIAFIVSMHLSKVKSNNKEKTLNK